MNEMYDTKAYRLLLTCEKVVTNRYGQTLILVWTEREDVIQMLKNAIAASLRFGEFIAVNAEQIPIFALFEDNFDSLTDVAVLLISGFHFLQGNITIQQTMYNTLFSQRISAGKNTIIFSSVDVFKSESEYISNIKALLKTAELYRI